MNKSREPRVDTRHSRFSLFSLPTSNARPTFHSCFYSLYSTRKERREKIKSWPECPASLRMSLRLTLFRVNICSLLFLSPPPPYPHLEKRRIRTAHTSAVCVSSKRGAGVCMESYTGLHSERLAHGWHVIEFSWVTTSLYYMFHWRSTYTSLLFSRVIILSSPTLIIEALAYAKVISLLFQYIYWCIQRVGKSQINNWISGIWCACWLEKRWCPEGHGYETEFPTFLIMFGPFFHLVDPTNRSALRYHQ